MSNPNCYCRGKSEFCIYCNDFGNYTQAMMKRLEEIESQPDFWALWHGRPKVKKLKWIECPVYVFNSTDSWKTSPFVHVNPSQYLPVDWRGII